MFNNSFKNRILIGFIVVFIMMMITNIFTIHQLRKTSKNTLLNCEQSIISKNTVKDMKLEIFNAARLFRDTRFANTRNSIDSLIDEINKSDSIIYNYFKVINFQCLTFQCLSNVENIDIAKSNYSNWKDFRNRVFKLKKDKHNDSVEYLLKNVNFLYIDTIMHNANHIAAHADYKSIILKAEAIKFERNTLFISFGLLFLSSIIVLLISFYLSINITKSIKKFVLDAKTIFTHHNDKHPIKYRNEQELFSLTLSELKQSYQNIEYQNQILKELNITKDKLFSILAHDLRNPFSTLLGFTELLKRNIKIYDTLKTETIINQIHDLTTQTYQLLENLLDWSLSQRGKLELNVEKIDLLEDANKVINILRPIADIKNITVILEFSSPLYVFVDKNMLNSVLRNLISNAIKYTNKDGVVTIKAVENDSEVLISVADNGVGIKSENIGKLFQLESNFSCPGTLGEKGTGLGLILCKEFVEKHGGKIWVESIEGMGSTFYITLKQ